MSLTLQPISLRTAAGFVAEHHSHHRPPQGGKFAVGIFDGQTLAPGDRRTPSGPDARDGLTAEVTRLCTDGTPHAASKALTHAKRAAQAMGYRRVVTYTLFNESGMSLQAAAWRMVKGTKAEGWGRPARDRTDKHPTVQKTRWEAA